MDDPDDLRNMDGPCCADYAPKAAPHPQRQYRDVMAELLSSDDVATALAHLAGWTGDTSRIERSIQAPSFLAGIRLVDAVAEAAEAANHHPDIDIRWRTVTFRLSTHDSGGVTDMDVTLARRINALAGSTA
jgi:4a-hydroxytetrahydrobiopterin dehydratase